MATTADFKGLDWLAHELSARHDLTEHHKVECVWEFFPSAPVRLVRQVLALGEHRIGCPHHIAPDDVKVSYQSWRPGGPSAARAPGWGISSDQLRAMGNAMQHPTTKTIRFHHGPDGSVYGVADEPAINDLLTRTHELLDTLDELERYTSVLSEEDQNRAGAEMLADLGQRRIKLTAALARFEAEQYEHSEQQRHAEESDAVAHAQDPVTP